MGFKIDLIQVLFKTFTFIIVIKIANSSQDQGRSQHGARGLLPPDFSASPQMDSISIKTVNQHLAMGQMPLKIFH